MHVHTKFGIPTSNNMRDISGHKYSQNYVKGQGHSGREMLCDTPPSQDAPTYQIYGIPISNDTRDMLWTRLF